MFVRFIVEKTLSYWDRDLFARRALAENLIKYANSVSASGTVLDTERSLVLTVDADYGVGKTFFLKGLEALAKDQHPVAYIDAWADDIFDDPTTALAAVLKKAIQPLIQTDPNVKEKWAKYAQAAGKVVLLGSKGLAVRSAQFLLTREAVEGISAALEMTDESELSDLSDAVKDAVEDFKDEIDDGLRSLNANKVISSRISEFEAGVAALKDMRKALQALVRAVDGKQKRAPVYIIIDELDRCRPSYAIKLLEEIKHLFSVSEVVFVLGMNARQLGHAVSGLYGEKFEGSAYLSRFVDRHIKLPFPGLQPLAQSLQHRVDPDTKIKIPVISVRERNLDSSCQFVSEVLTFYNISPRDVFKFYDRLQTSLAVIGSYDVDFIFLVELIAQEISGHFPERGRPWRVYFKTFRESEWIEGDVVISKMRSLYSMNPRTARGKLGENPFDEYLSFGLNPSASVPATEYREILEQVVDLGAEDGPIT